jgi:hypothetical protein
MATQKIETGLIADSAVTTAKLADNSVTAAKIAAGSLDDQLKGISSSADAVAITIDSSEKVTVGSSLTSKVFNVVGTYENTGFYRDYSGAGVAANYVYIGRKDTNGALVDGVRISGGGDDAVAASHTGYFELAINKSGTFIPLLYSVNGTELVVNENSVDLDFRVESNGNANMLFVDGGNDRVGIGTTSPQGTFVVSNSGAGGFEFTPDTTAFSIANTNYIASYDRSASAYRDIVVDLGGAESQAVRFKVGGNVGIGTSAPVAKLDVRMSDSNGDYGRGRDGNLNLENTNTAVTEGGWLSISGYMGNSASSGQYQMGYISGGKQTTAGDGDYGGYLTFWTTSGGANGEANSGGYERMRIDSSGNVLINKTSHDGGGKLEISHGSSAPALYTLGGYNYQAKFESSDAEAAIIIQDSGSTNNGNRIGVIGDVMAFTTANSERMRITSTGNLQFKSTTTTFTGASSFTNHSNGVLYLRGGTSGLRLDDSDSHNTIHVSGAGDYIAFETTNGTERWRFNSTGHFTPAQQHTYDIGGVNAEVRNIYAQGLYVGGTGSANKLDDYEEGTWTGTVSSSTATTVTWGVGNYTKIGNMVYASFRVSVSEQTVGDNYIILYGPFAQHTGSIDWIGFCTNYNSGNRESGIIINNSSGNTNEWFVGWQSNSTASKNIRGLIIYQTS